MSKICFYVESYYVGGLDTFTVQLINNWNPNDDLTLICNKSHSGAQYYQDKITNPRCKVEIHDMPMVNDWERKVKHHYLGRIIHLLSFLILAPYYILWGYKRLNLKRFEYLQIINGGYPAGVSSRCVGISWWFYTKKKVLHNFHNFAMNLSLLNEIPNRVIDKLVIKSTKWFVSVSCICAESLRSRKYFKELPNITYIYNGTDNIVCKPTFDLRNQLGLPPTTKLLIMLATYEVRKGHKYIVDVLNNVWKQNQNIHLVFMGFGTDDEINGLKEYITDKQLDKAITILGFHTNAMEYLAQADFVLIGSQSFESFGLTAIEAMKYRKVVLSTNVGGLKEVIEDGDGGFLFDPDDVTGMANKIVNLINDEEEVHRQIEKGHERYMKRFRVERVSEEYRKLLVE